MARVRASGKERQRSGTQSSTSLEALETATRPLLNRVRDTLTRRTSPREYWTAEGRPPTPFAPYPHMDEGDRVPHRQHVTRSGSERRRANRQTEITEPTPVRVRPFASFLGLHPSLTTTIGSTEPPESAESQSRSERLSTAVNERDDSQNRGLALLDHLLGRRPLNWRRLELPTRNQMLSRGPFSGLNRFSRDPPPPYVTRCYGYSVEDLVPMPARPTFSRLARTAGGRAGGHLASEAQSTNNSRDAADVAVGLQNDNMQGTLTSIVAGPSVQIRWNGGRLLRIWRQGVLVAAVTIDDDMHAEVTGAEAEDASGEN